MTEVTVPAREIRMSRELHRTCSGPKLHQATSNLATDLKNVPDFVPEVNCQEVLGGGCLVSDEASGLIFRAVQELDNEGGKVICRVVQPNEQ